MHRIKHDYRLGGIHTVAKVLGFLDLAGRWDPSLALVMVGATAIGAAGFAVATRRATTLLGTPMLLPKASEIDRRLVFGSLLFVGWGLAGFCPGPALAAGRLKAMAFVAAMIAGMLVFEWIEGARVRSAASAGAAAAGVCE